MTFTNVYCCENTTDGNKNTFYVHSYNGIKKHFGIAISMSLQAVSEKVSTSLCYARFWREEICVTWYQTVSQRRAAHHAPMQTSSMPRLTDAHLPFLPGQYCYMNCIWSSSVASYGYACSVVDGVLWKDTMKYWANFLFFCFDIRELPCFMYKSMSYDLCVALAQVSLSPLNLSYMGKLHFRDTGPNVAALMPQFIFPKFPLRGFV